MVHSSSVESTILQLNWGVKKKTASENAKKSAGIMSAPVS